MRRRKKCQEILHKCQIHRPKTLKLQEILELNSSRPLRTEIRASVWRTMARFKILKWTKKRIEWATRLTIRLTNSETVCLGLTSWALTGIAKRPLVRLRRHNVSPQKASSLRTSMIHQWKIFSPHSLCLLLPILSSLQIDFSPSSHRPSTFQRPRKCLKKLRNLSKSKSNKHLLRRLRNSK